jgi:beta-aspartyl-peptidase (threonine type)
LTPSIGGQEGREEPVRERHLLSVPAIAVHGGAGTFERVSSGGDEAELGEALRVALDAAWAVLAGGGPALESVVEAVAALEDSGMFNAGRSGTLTEDGFRELDAAVMDGATGRFGGVCATSWPKNPVRAALALWSLGGPAHGPVLLAGVGADQFASEHGLAEMGSGIDEMDGMDVPGSETGTVGAVAVDSGGHLAAATSTGGRAGQLRGRVGDSPVPGAGTWADDETVAVSGTGEGEAFMVAGFAHIVDWSVREGSSLEDAVGRSISEVSRRGGEGGAITMSATGELVCMFDTKAMARGWRDLNRTTVAVLRTEP